MEPEGSWPVLNQANEVTLVLTPDPKEALPLEQLQHVLGPYSEKLFDDLQEEQPAMESAAEAEEAEIALELASHIELSCDRGFLGLYSLLWVCSGLTLSCMQRRDKSTAERSPVDSGTPPEQEAYAESTGDCQQSTYRSEDTAPEGAGTAVERMQTIHYAQATASVWLTTGDNGLRKALYPDIFACKDSLSSLCFPRSGPLLLLGSVVVWLAAAGQRGCELLLL
ncbi:hypothetical protein UY3_07434 [Chelonia mydas]|uniref:Uncharacterized protein n=1 Tax=Chelonia mydas TaxID=8469 RepID=M7BII7_CHEMY|nr:hypothetical protein UY3_07434 [Chelonia mydas]